MKLFQCNILLLPLTGNDYSLIKFLLIWNRKMWTEKWNVRAGVHHEKNLTFPPRRHSELPWPTAALAKSIEALGKWLLKHVSGVSDWLPLCPVEGTVWNRVSLPHLPPPSFMRARRASELLSGVSNNNRLYLQVKVGPAAGVRV